jgi:amino acid transporter
MKKTFHVLLFLALSGANAYAQPSSYPVTVCASNLFWVISWLANVAIVGVGLLVFFVSSGLSSDLLKHKKPEHNRIIKGVKKGLITIIILILVVQVISMFLMPGMWRGDWGDRIENSLMKKIVFQPFMNSCNDKEDCMYRPTRNHYAPCDLQGECIQGQCIIPPFQGQ